MKDTRPEQSPYTSPTVEIILSGTIFHIPCEILNKCPQLSAAQHENNVQISVEVGHVVVNYLFTNGYECLKPIGRSLKEKASSELKTAFQVSRACQEYDLPHLGELANTEIERLGDRLSLLQIIDAFEEAGPNPKHLPGFSAYLQSRIHLLCNDLTASDADRRFSGFETPRTAIQMILNELVGWAAQHTRSMKDSGPDGGSNNSPQFIKKRNLKRDIIDEDFSAPSGEPILTSGGISRPSTEMTATEPIEDGWSIANGEATNNTLLGESEPSDTVCLEKIQPAELDLLYQETHTDEVSEVVEVVYSSDVANEIALEDHEIELLVAKKTKRGGRLLGKDSCRLLDLVERKAERAKVEDSKAAEREARAKAAEELRALLVKKARFGLNNMPLGDSDTKRLELLRSRVTKTVEPSAGTMV